MKALVLMLSMLLVAQVSYAEAENSNVLQKSEKQSAFKGIFYKVWSKFKTISPKNDKQLKRTNITAGIRGAETTTSILQPYWKGDRTSNEDFIQQLEEFAQAQAKADRGELDNASTAFADFVKQWPDSDLKPNAQFGQAMALGALGQLEQSRNLFNQFIQAYPSHPMVEDARELISRM